MCVLAAAFGLTLIAPPAHAAYAAEKLPEGSLTLAADATIVQKPASQPGSAANPGSAEDSTQQAAELQVPNESGPVSAGEVSGGVQSAADVQDPDPGSPSAEPASPNGATQPADAADSSTGNVNADQETGKNVSLDTSLLKASSARKASSEAGSSVRAQSADGSGSISVFTPHEADITYSASEGGAVALGTDGGGNASSDSVNEHFGNSLADSAVGATAIPNEGYHFLRWVDVLTGATLATSPTFVPNRPNGGWQVSWYIEAEFARDTYVLILDPNGGTAGGGGGGSGVVALEVTPGSDFKIPANGSDAVSMTRAGSAFVGWNTAADPGKEGTTSSYAIADGQILDATTESWLERLNVLNLDWSNGNIPSVTLYAQWLVGQVAIKYTANDGGMIAPNNSSSDVASTAVSEIMDANTGVHAYDPSSVGPSGATAVADARNHFTGWTVSGSSNSFGSDEASSADLSSDVVTRMTYYPNNTNMASKYHGATFSASFAPNTYILAYEANGGTGSIDPASLTYGSTSTAASSGVTRNGYELTGWNLSSNGSGTSIALGATLDSTSIDSMISSGVMRDENAASATLYAQWKYVGGEDSEPADGSDSTPTPTPTPIPVPIVLPDPEPEAAPVSPVVEPDDNSGSGSDSEEDQSGLEEVGAEAAFGLFNTLYSYADAQVVGVSGVQAGVSNMAEAALKATAGKEEPGLLASSKSDNSGSVVVAYDAGANGSSYAGGANGENENVLDQLMSPEGLQQAGTTVAAVAAVGTLMGLVGIGVSVAGAAVVSAATIGAAGAVGLTTAADLAADLAATAAVGAGAAAKRRREDEEENGEEPQEEGRG